MLRGRDRDGFPHYPRSPFPSTSAPTIPMSRILAARPCCCVGELDGQRTHITSSLSLSTVAVNQVLFAVCTLHAGRKLYHMLSLFLKSSLLLRLFAKFFPLSRCVSLDSSFNNTSQSSVIRSLCSSGTQTDRQTDSHITSSLISFLLFGVSALHIDTFSFLIPATSVPVTSVS